MSKLTSLRSELRGVELLVIRYTIYDIRYTISVVKQEE